MLVIAAGPYCVECGSALREWEPGWWWCDHCWFGSTTMGCTYSPKAWKEVTVEVSNYAVDPNVATLPPDSSFPKGGAIVYLFQYGTGHVAVEVRQPSGEPFVLVHGRPYGAARVFRRFRPSELEEGVLERLVAFDDEAATTLAEACVDDALEMKRTGKSAAELQDAVAS